MKTKLALNILTLAWLSTLNPQLSAAPLDTAFTYQGRLNDGTDAANGSYDLQFSLYDALASGSPVGNSLTNTAMSVTNGYFTVTLNFGSVFDGNARWLEIAVRTNGAAAFTTLTPRQPLTAEPYALFAPDAGAAATATSADTASTAFSVANNAVTSAGIAPGQVVKSLNGLTDALTLAAGANSTLTPSGNTLTLETPSDWHLTGNSGTTPGAHFLGTTDNQPLELKVNNQRALRLEPNTNGAPNVIGGFEGNQVGAGVYAATIAGGGGASAPHLVAGNGGTVGGGAENQALGMVATVGGGQANVAGASGATVAGGAGNTIATNAGFATIAGGQQNVVPADSGASSIGGGSQNRATNALATVGGGNQNLAGGLAATVAGGQFNEATGWYTAIAGGSGNHANGLYGFVGGGDHNNADGSVSFAAGRRAKANHQGAFVWADSTDADFASTANNQFLIRAAGGVGIGLNNPQTALHVAGTVRAESFQGDGSGLTALSAASLGSGTITSTINFNPPTGPPFITGNQNVATGLNADFLDGWHGDHFWQIGGNSGVGANAFLGTTDNQPLEFRVNGRRALRLEPTTNGAPNVIGGSERNFIGPRVNGATIGGGGGTSGGPAYTNAVLADLAVVGGGGGNTIQLAAIFSAIGGGQANSIGQESPYSTLGGGAGNTIRETSYSATIAGGTYNTNFGNDSTISGGWGNTVHSDYAMIPGGQDNLADGTYSFAAGRHARAQGPGSFVWADSQDFPVYAFGANQFVLRATGGYWLFSGVDGSGNPTSGVVLPAGSGSWGVWSDRNAKTNCAPVEARAVLDKVAALPIATWNYKTQDPSIRHIGPMAQDFHAAFGVGDSDKTISTVDADGVALVAIQGLNQKVEEQRAENAELKRRLAHLEQLVLKLTAKGE